MTLAFTAFHPAPAAAWDSSESPLVKQMYNANGRPTKLIKIGLFGFHRVEEAITIDAQAAERAMEDISEALAALA